MASLSNIMKHGLTIAGVLVGIVGGTLASIRGCDMFWNNQTIDHPAYVTHSHATGLWGHVEYTRYADGTRDVKSYPTLPWHFYESELLQDLDGDGRTVERIRRSGPEIKMNKLIEILVRGSDYEDHKARFDAADKKLQELVDTYDIN